MNVLNLFRGRGRRVNRRRPARQTLGSGRRHRLRVEPLEERRLLTNIATWGQLAAIDDSAAALADSYTLTADLAAVDAPANWTPLGTSADPFTGSFDGNTKSIDGLTISGSAQYAGLFGYADGATLTDIVLDDVDIDISRSASSYAGGLVGKAVDTNIVECEVQAGSDIDVVLTSGGAYVGGMVGVFRGTDAAISAEEDDVEDESLANATISVSGATSSVYAGGLVGYHRGEGGVLSLSQCGAGGSVTVTGSSTIYGGGLAGYFYIGTSTDNTEVLAERCRATGDVDIESSGGTEYAGGLMGYARMKSWSAADIEGAIEDCYATGDVRADGTGNSYAYAGGLVGYAESDNDGNSAALSFYNCYADGSVTATSSSTAYAGGLVGRYYTEDGGTFAVENCFATGVADATNATTTYEGGLAGYNGTATHTNCWWYNGTNANAVGSGSSSGISKADARSDFYDDEFDVYDGHWDFATGPDWAEPDSALPLLYWETV